MPNGGTDNCMNCQYNRANQPTGNIKATRGAERVPFCSLRQVVVAHHAWTYCRNIYDDVVEEILPIYSTGLYERGYQRIPWYGLAEPIISVNVEVCNLCGEGAESGIVIPAVGHDQLQFCCNDHYYDWLEKHPFSSALTEEEQQLHKAANEGCVEEMEKCIELGAGVDSQDENGRAAIHFAALKGHDSAVKVLLEAESNPNLKTGSRWTALHCAAHGGSKETVSLLLNAGVDATKVDLMKYTAAHIAGCEGYSDILAMLLEQSLITDVQRVEGLFSAIRAGNLEMVECLIKAGVDIESENYRKRTPLLEAVWESQATILTFLLDQGADLYAEDHYGVTAFTIIDEWDPKGKSEVGLLVAKWNQIKTNQ